MKRILCLFLTAALALSLAPAAFAQALPEEGPTAEVAAAITLGLAPQSVGGGWQQPMTRGGLCRPGDPLPGGAVRLWPVDRLSRHLRLF